ncbi:hypothetical protein [Acidocella aromatica]|uniref:Uncharacterized protein n=1 Tax=Acidocella aromatica TaxID=1303579 RepID=A0A840VCQ2_9PROT|nr:hypothetical protein [Acidocella aromatica]MBB5373603.1 hypothetical protein [Acidocella aromatica]
MRIQLFPTFSHDGFGGHAVAQSQREAGNAVVAAQAQAQRRDEENRTEHRDHDDGLVHGHFWAMSSTVR